MSKKVKTKKVSYIAPAAVILLIVRGIFTGGGFNIVVELAAVCVAAIGLIGAIVALLQKGNGMRKGVTIVALVLIVYLGGVAVYRLILSNVGFLG